VVFEDDLLLNEGEKIQFSQSELLDVSAPPRKFKRSHFRRGSNIWHGKVTLGQPHIFQIENAKYDPRTEFWYDEENKIIDNVPGRSENIHLLYRNSPYECIDEGNILEFELALALLPSSNYWGWLHNQLTQLQAFEEFLSVNNSTPKILINSGAPKYVKQSLLALGYEDYVVECDPTSNIHVRRLLASSNRFPRNKFQSNYVKQKLVSPLAANWLRNKFAQELNLKEYEKQDKIIISRADVGMRRISNFEEIEEFALSYGFKTYELAELDFSEQFKLFYSANQIMGIHGAGLTNMIFSKDCHIIEILNAQRKPSFFYLSQCLPVTYECVSGKIIKDDVSSKNNDIFVNVTDLNL
jgi:hypothetical protein